MARAARRFRGDTRGATAVEFAIVVVPFLALILAIMTIGMQYMTMHFLENGVASAARQLRTGEAQKSGMTLNNFRQLVCSSAAYLSCDENHLVIHIKSSPTFAGLAPLTNCLTNGKLTPSAGSANDGIRTRAGDANAAVVVTACYDWEAGVGLWQTIWNLISPVPPAEGGKYILSAVAAFRSEPFE